MSFAEYCARKTARAAGAAVTPLRTTQWGEAGDGPPEIGNDWTRARYDGGFRLCDLPIRAPAVTLVFVQSREGNTGTDDPGALGGGETDLHLVYEGLSRVAADAVLAGGATANGDVFFSVWHPEIVALRESLGLPRHPAQVVVSREGKVDLDETLLFNVPDARVFLILGNTAHDRLSIGLSRRPWIRLLRSPDGDLRAPLEELRSVHGVDRISCVGGRTLATNLIDADLVQDLCLTTTSRSAGEPNTPFYAGTRQLRGELIVRKHGANMRFEHLALS
jgi:riboflavin biosynthesis pyrimidine reductase